MRSSAAKVHLKGEESASPVELSIAHPAHSQPSMAHHPNLSSVEEAIGSHGALKLAHHASVRDVRDQQSVLDSLHGTTAQHITAHRNSTSPVAMQFGAAARFYGSAPALPAPLAHTASWLAAAGATAAGFKGHHHRGTTASPYDNFGLSSYAAGFSQAAHSSSHLSRLGLLNSPPPLGPIAAVGDSEHHTKASHTPETTSSAGSHPQPYGQSTTANPDFSQLLE